MHGLKPHGFPAARQQLEAAVAVGADASWITFATAPHVIGDEQVVTVDLGHGAQFFRLTKPSLTERCVACAAAEEHPDGWDRGSRGWARMAEAGRCRRVFLGELSAHCGRHIRIVQPRVLTQSPPSPQRTRSTILAQVCGDRAPVIITRNRDQSENCMLQMQHKHVPAVPGRSARRFVDSKPRPRYRRFPGRRSRTPPPSPRMNAACTRNRPRRRLPVTRRR